jgi:hypothetical protein
MHELLADQDSQNTRGTQRTAQQHTRRCLMYVLQRFIFIGKMPYWRTAISIRTLPLHSTRLPPPAERIPIPQNRSSDGELGVGEAERIFVHLGFVWARGRGARPRPPQPLRPTYNLQP